MTGSPETGCLLHRLRLPGAHENRGQNKSPVLQPFFEISRLL